MDDKIKKHLQQIERQINHWNAAIERLGGWSTWASEQAWRSLEQYLDFELGEKFGSAIERLRHKTADLKRQAARCQSREEIIGIRRALIKVRREFVQVETMLDYFGDAVNTRTSTYMSAMLRACDRLSELSMYQILQQFGQKSPPVLAYIDKGLGASILKAGLRLWDGNTINPVSTIKIVRHNLLRPTSLIHETGHQVAHQLNWTGEMATVIESRLAGKNSVIGKIWRSWTSEIVADVFAFVHTGYASVTALHDVVAGDTGSVFTIRPFDPHPMSYLRVLLAAELCRQTYGSGPWDDLAAAWKEAHPLSRAPAESRSVVEQSLPLLTTLAGCCLTTPLKAFRGKSIVRCIDPQRVSAKQLTELESRGGEALYNSTHYARSEALRITALTGYRASMQPKESGTFWKKQEQFMMRLGEIPNIITK